MTTRRTPKNPKPECIIPGCGRRQASRLLCNRHDHKRRAGLSIEQIVETERTPKVGRRPYTTRLTEATIEKFERNARALGFPSGYKLTSHILEAWEPPKKSHGS